MTRDEFKKEVAERIGRYKDGVSWYGVARSLVENEHLEFTDQIGQVLDEIEKEGLVVKKGEKYFATAG